MFGELLRRIGDFYEKKESKYVPDLHGDLVNIGDDYNEQWVWEQKIKDPVLYVIVTDDYPEDNDKFSFSITISDFPDKDALYCRKCEGEFQLELSIDTAKAYYSAIGSISISNDSSEIVSENLLF
jgi:hypothetical protein